MPKTRRFSSFLLLLATLLACSAREARAALWSTRYYAGWMQGYLPPSAIDFAALTHPIDFSGFRADNINFWLRDFVVVTP